MLSLDTWRAEGGRGLDAAHALCLRAFTFVCGLGLVKERGALERLA